MSLNKTMLIGNLGSTPELTYTGAGKPVINISMATSRSWKDKQTGEKKEHTEWHRLVFFGRLAEVTAEYLQKGSKLYVEGELHTRDFEQDGVKRYMTEIVVRNMEMLDGKKQAPEQPVPDELIPAGNYPGLDDDPF